MCCLSLILWLGATIIIGHLDFGQVLGDGVLYRTAWLSLAGTDMNLGARHALLEKQRVAVLVE